MTATLYFFIFFVLFVINSLIFGGFLTTYFIGRLTTTKAAKTTGKLGMIIVGSLTGVLLIITIIAAVIFSAAN
ncbi:hypothetical protein [Furfurilactobacillus entadae]|uniref:hypothetical protein n=1 Tax=Furfurilactobacillus entadae TaxID=2922307 RepID=UPI0035E6E174